MFIKIWHIVSADSPVGSVPTYSAIALQAFWVPSPGLWTGFPDPAPLSRFNLICIEPAWKKMFSQFLQYLTSSLTFILVWECPKLKWWYGLLIVYDKLVIHASAKWLMHKLLKYWAVVFIKGGQRFEWTEFSMHTEWEEEELTYLHFKIILHSNTTEELN